MSQLWAKPILLHELARGAVTIALEPDAAERAGIAKRLGLERLLALNATLTLSPWMDGVEISGRFEARVEQLCAVSLEPFEQSLSGPVELRAVPAGSALAPVPVGGEIDYDLEAPDPPDVLDGETIDASAYVVEHLALEIDPFARRPGIAFEYTPPEEEKTPFAALKALQDRKT